MTLKIKKQEKIITEDNDLNSKKNVTMHENIECSKTNNDHVLDLDESRQAKIAKLMRIYNRYYLA